MIAKLDDRDKWSHLSIGTTDDRIDLLDRFGFMAHDWIPIASPIEDYFGESSLGDFRQLLDYRDLTTIDTIPVWVLRPRPNGSIASTRALRVMLRRARDYWRDRYNGDPVYLEARRESEAESRFAVVLTGRAPNDSDPYGELMSARAGAAVMDAVTLEVEHLPWQSAAPGDGECVELSSLSSFAESSDDDSFPVLAGTDDVYADVNAQTVSTGSVAILFPWNTIGARPEHPAIRFDNVTIPVGATILSAYIQFEASGSKADVGIFMVIHGEKDPDPATFSASYPVYLERLANATDAKVYWPVPTSEVGIEPWTIANLYNTVDLSSIVQELVDQAGWASGQAMAFFLYPLTDSIRNYRQAATFDDGVRQPPTLFVTWTEDEPTRGQEATCEEYPRISNKHVLSQLTDGWYYDASAGTWTTILPAGALPTALFPAIPANGDRLIVGVDTDLANSGPFDNLVWDITTAAALTFPGGSTLLPYYWTGAAWAQLQMTDNTISAAGPFTTEGVNSMHWIPPSTWSILNLQTHFGGAAPNVNGLWIMFHLILAGGDSMIRPWQGNRQIYTANRGCVDIADDEVGGDMPAAALIKIRNQSDQIGISDPDLWSNRVLLGLRSVSRGEDFRAYINIADEQNHPSVVVNNIAAGTNFTTAWVARNVAPAGRCLRLTATAAMAEQEIATIYLLGDLPNQYLGDFHVFLRMNQTSGATEQIAVRLKWWSAGQEWETAQVWVQADGIDMIPIDFGRVSIPAGPLDVNDPVGFLSFSLYAQTLGALQTYFYDLVFVPVDEWAGDFRHEYLGESGFLGATLWDHNRLYIDGRVTVPKYDIRAVCYDRTNQSSAWTPRAAAGPALHHDERAMRLWSFQIQRNPIDGSTIDDLIALPAICSSIQIRKIERFASQRGDS